MDVFERALFGFRQVALELPQFFVAQRLDGVAIQPRDMEPLGADSDALAEDALAAPMKPLCSSVHKMRTVLFKGFGMVRKKVSTVARERSLTRRGW